MNNLDHMRTKMENLIDFNTDSVRKTINILLKDRSTGKNIIFATDQYDNDISFNTEITKEIINKNICDIRPRVTKSLEEQSARTRKKAEVFTPTWICNKMNNHCDSIWFEYENVFNTEKNEDHEWIPSNGEIEFPEGKSWKDYINSNRLEITCGEAPYLVSRYNATTGEIIPIYKRIGMLDRKLRIINENVKTKKSWNQWVYRAYESIYGYEYQGDNLLIARINLLETFCEYTRDRWNEEPTDSSLKRIANIISWNLWQMDGLHGVIPFKGELNIQEYNDEPHQMTMFEIMGIDDELESELKELPPEAVDCNIYDWREEKSISYKSMKGE